VRIYPGRFRSTEITFGPVGRIAMTVGLVIPVLLFLHGGLFGIVGLVVYVGAVLPRGLRDVWRDVPHPGQTRLEREHLMAPRPATEDDVAITDRQPPARW
jgi:hypothetical protein